MPIGRSEKLKWERGGNRPDSSLVACYIINKITGERITFYTIPAEISESYSASFETQGTIGRSAPFITYSETEARTVSYSVTLHEDICPDLVDIVNKVKALVYPNYAGSIAIPPYCYVKFGDMVSMYAVVNSVSVDWSETVVGDTQHFSKVEISFDFTEVRLGSIPTSSNPFQEGR